MATATAAQPTSDRLTCASLSPQYIAIFPEPRGGYHRSDAQRGNEINLKNNSPRGEISPKARKRINRAVQWSVLLAKEKRAYNEKLRSWYQFKLAFVTVTLSSPQVHDDRTIKRELLNQLLIEMRTRYGITRYLWRAEPQKNGNIHFHIIVDAFIHWQWLRNAWNRIQNKLQYIDRFEEIHGHRDPNSTDVHSLKKIKNVAGYLSKYVSKENEGREIGGRQWFISRELSQLKSTWDTVNPDDVADLERLQKEYPDSWLSFETHNLLLLPCSIWNKPKYPALQKWFTDYLQSVIKSN